MYIEGTARAKSTDGSTPIASSRRKPPAKSVRWNLSPLVAEPVARQPDSPTDMLGRLSLAKTDLRNIREQLAAREEECRALRNEKEKYEGEHGKIYSQMSLLRSKCQTFEGQLAKKTQEYGELSAKRVELEDECKRLRGLIAEEANKHQVRIKGLEAQVKSLKTELDSAKETIDKAGKTASPVQDHQIQQLLEERSRQQTLNNDLARRLEESRTEMRKMSTDRACLVQDVYRLKEEVKSRASKKNELTMDEELQLRLASLETERSNAKTALKKAMAIIDQEESFRAELQRKDEKIQLLKQKLKSQTTALPSLDALKLNKAQQIPDSNIIVSPLTLSSDESYSPRSDLLRADPSRVDSLMDNSPKLDSSAPSFSAPLTTDIDKGVPEELRNRLLALQETSARLRRLASQEAPMTARFTVPTRVRSSNISQVVEELKTLHDSLCKVDQSQFEMLQDELVPVAERLVHSELLNSADKTIKLLVSCLESLATVKSIVLLLDVDDSMGARERLLQQLFGLIFDLAPLPNVTRTAKLYLLEIAQTLIDESDTISSDIVRCVMQKCGDIREETRIFAADLVRLCSDKLQPSLGLLFNEAVLAYTGDSNDQQKRIEPLRQVHLQIIQVGRVSPAAVASVVAQLEEELQTADAELRLLAMNSLSSFLTCPDQDVPKLYPHLWQSWLNKMNDKVAAVRLQWFKLAVSMLHGVGLQYKIQLQKALAEKLLDIDAKVREKSIVLLKKSLEDTSTPALFGVDIVEEVGGRCRDKVADVQFVAVDLLCEIIHRQFKVDPNHQCFSVAVNALFKLIYTNDRDLRLFYEYFIEHGAMFPKLDVAEHARYLVCMYRVLGDEAHKAFKRWLNDKAIFVKYFDAYLKLVEINPEDQRLEALNQHLSNQYRLPLPAQSMLKALPITLTKETLFLEQFRHLVQPNKSIKSQKDLVETLSSRNWEKTDARLKEYLITFTVRRACMLSINNEILTAVLKLSDKELYSSARKLIADIISEFPALGVSHASVLQDAIVSESGSSIDTLSSYARFASACLDKITPRDDFFEFIITLVNTGTRQQAKYATRILLAFKSKWPVLSNILENISLDNARSWQILVELATQPAILGPSELLTIKEKTLALMGPLSTSAEAWPIKRVGLALDNYTFTEICAVLAVRCIRNLLTSLRNVDQNREMEQLRLFAPLFVEWLSVVQSPRVQYAISKALVGFVPRPTATTVVTNLHTLLTFISGCPSMVRDRLTAFITRQYQLGHIGMIYLSIPLLEVEGRSAIKDTLVAIKKADRWADSIIPHDDRSVEITSRSLRRYEDWFIVTLIISALNPSEEALDDMQLAKYTTLVDLLTEIVANELNVSYLFDSAVQLKRYEFVGEYAARNKHLYVLSELSQNSLRASATSHKWLLQSIKTPISLTDDLLQELSTIEDVGKNVHRSYLVRAIEKNRKSDESMRLDALKDNQHTKNELKSQFVNNEPSMKHGINSELNANQSTNKSAPMVMSELEECQTLENKDSTNESVIQEAATKRIRRSGRNRATGESDHVQL
ncbi:pds5 sister chromatid condensation and cohesion [Paramicrosporidium saccamoebae]|uniref:Pds5 sister chromatid condensation and cohesion n=1 Tax=Paramicrosporidium saccamoebae TaxID=1246581 RepID=A0A2H9TGX6_9FUNG|nr:pds5 sister chromatid condensation and cohesion [Paramicrosporidium saccamoebae]